MSYLEVLRNSGFAFFVIGDKIAIDAYFSTKQAALSILKKLGKYVFVGAKVTPTFVAHYQSKGIDNVLFYRYSGRNIEDQPHQYPFDLSDNSTCRFCTQPSSE